MDISIISSLVECTLHSLDDSVLLTANWVLELLDLKEALEEVTDITIALADIQYFQDSVGKPFISNLKNNISNRFSSQDIVSSFSIFDPKKIPSPESPLYARYGEDSIDILKKPLRSGQTSQDSRG